MRILLIPALLGLATPSGPAPAVAAPGAPAPHCIWDSDTLDDEMRGLPGAHDLLTGRWYRHGRAYYEARIARLPQHLAAHPEDLAGFDDLAVAHERLGDRARAKQVMADKEQALREHPDEVHRYRLHANLGTFHAHSGEFDAALAQLGKALEIDPQAHFGRERYQVDLIRYVRAARATPELWGQQSFLAWAGYRIEDRSWHPRAGRLSFRGKVAARDDAARTVPWTEAYTGVAGMLRFGGLEGPELYRTLGDLFLLKEHLHLGWWAYMHAIERGHPATDELRAAVTAIEKHWREAAKHRRNPDLRVPDADVYRRVRANADAWLAAFHAAERAALAAGEDPGSDAVLARLLRAADAAAPRLPEASLGTHPLGDAGQAGGAWGPAEGDAQRSREAQGQGPAKDVGSPANGGPAQGGDRTPPPASNGGKKGS